MYVCTFVFMYMFVCNFHGSRRAGLEHEELDVQGKGDCPRGMRAVIYAALFYFYLSSKKMGSNTF